MPAKVHFPFSPPIQSETKGIEVEDPVGIPDAAILRYHKKERVIFRRFLRLCHK